MYDSVTAGAIPADAEMVAGYIDGHYRWSDQDWARFPHAVKVRIAVHASTNDGHVLDIESGDATPAQGPGWVLMRRRAGADPSVYCSLAVWDQVRGAFRAAGVREPYYWIAAYPGNGANLYPGSVAHQYANQGPHGENVDVSVVAEHWPGVDGEEDMALSQEDKNWIQGTIHDYVLDIVRKEGISANAAAAVAKLDALTVSPAGVGTKRTGTWTED
jgi:hypothetical protein